MKIVGIHMEPGAVGWHRVWCWMDAMKRLGHKVVHKPHEGTQFYIDDDSLDQMVRGADVVVAGRMHDARAFSGILAGRDLYKYRIIVDTDDDLDSLPAYNHASVDYHSGTGMARICRAEYTHADMVTVSTDHLRGKTEKYAKRTAVIPNVVDPRIYASVRDRQKEPRHRDDLRIYWGGGFGHYDDLLVVKDALLRVFRERPNVKLVFSGFIPDWASDLPPFRVFMVRFAPFETYAKVLKWICADVALAPLVDNEFNKSKSHVKYLTYAMAGIPGVYSSLLPYDSVEHGLTGLKAANSEEWYEAINTLLDNPSQRKAIAACAVDDVMENWTVDKWAPKYEALLEEVAVKKPVPEFQYLPEEAPCLMSHP
jgi:glycosyltransferase involved in cell wall biosynthesis